MAFTKFKVKKGILETLESSSVYYDAIPVGLILPHSSTVAPEGWLLCDGSTISVTVFPELYSLIGATLPNLNGDIIIGSGTGTGGGASGTGIVSGGSALSARTINTSPANTDNVSIVDFTHSHGLESHTHGQPHVHAYPHSHTVNHSHNFPHATAHGIASLSTSPANHLHTFAGPNGSAPGSSLQVANSGSLGAGPFSSSGAHVHSLDTTSVTSGAQSGALAPETTASFGTSASTETVAVAAPADTTTAVGNVTPTSTFSIKQPVVSTTYIIKY